MEISDFDYHLPEELIAQEPIDKRDESRLLVLNRKNNSITHDDFKNLSQYLNPGELLVINNTKVMPARLIGRKDTGAKVEIVLLRKMSGDIWEALVKPGNKVKPGAKLIFKDNLMTGEVIDFSEQGGRIVKFKYEGSFNEILQRIGTVPLPPYIKKELDDESRYQTTFAKSEGSAAAPTAGLHFTPQLIEELKSKGVGFTEILLHIGLDTFRPVKVQDIKKHEMHSEYFEIPEETARKINMTKRKGNKIICVGTTSVRVLETKAEYNGLVNPGFGWSDLYIYPGYNFKIVDALITNFHLPRSTLLILVSAFAGRERVLRAYAEAVNLNYRFFSFGDAMLIE